MSQASSFILRLYFAVVSAVTLFTLMYGTIDFLTIGLKTYVFTYADGPTYLEQCDLVSQRMYLNDGSEEYDEEAVAACELRNENQKENYKVQKASDAVRNLALIVVSLPLFALHFRIVYRDWTERGHSEKKKPTKKK